MRLRSNARQLKNEPSIKTWDSSRLALWLKSIELCELIPLFQNEKIDGATLLELTEENLKNDLNLKLGDRKKIIRERDALISQEKVSATPSFTLKKGYLPEGTPFSFNQLELIKNYEYSPQKKDWIRRDIPLTQEELDCWQDQANWLVCPISGKKWQDTVILLIGNRPSSFLTFF